jgi:hypothetical protein
MATDIRVIKAGDFLRVTSGGVIDLESSKQVLTGIAEVAQALHEYSILIDMRQARPELTITDLWYLAAELDNHRRAFSGKTAVLCPLEGFDNAGFFALAASNRGHTVKAFISFEEAFDWLVK